MTGDTTKLLSVLNITHIHYYNTQIIIIFIQCEITYYLCFTESRRKEMISKSLQLDVYAGPASPLVLVLIFFSSLTYLSLKAFHFVEHLSGALATYNGAWKHSLLRYIQYALFYSTEFYSASPVAQLLSRHSLWL